MERKILCIQCFPKPARTDSLTVLGKGKARCLYRPKDILSLASHASNQATVGDSLAARGSTNIVTANKSAPNFNVIK